MENDVFILILVVLMVASNALLLWFFLRRGNKDTNTDNDGLAFLQRDMQELSRVLNRGLNDMIAGVTEVKESGKQVFSIADQLKQLERVLTHQKQRGALGEESLKLCLENMLAPEMYKLQYPFLDGMIVDAIIMTKEGMIPVDAKFSLDNYNRIVTETDKDRRAELEKEFRNDLKRRIDETAKYIRPQEGTLSFAFMFLPAEGIYYDLLVNEVGTIKSSTRSLIEYAYNDKHVIIVSPTTFAAYLKSVLYGFKAFKIEESALEMRKNVDQLMKHLKAYDEYFKKVGASLGTTVNHFNNAQKELGKIDKDMYRITSDRMDLDGLVIEPPAKEEAV